MKIVHFQEQDVEATKEDNTLLVFFRPHASTPSMQVNTGIKLNRSSSME